MRSSNEQPAPKALMVFISTRDSTCDECGENLGHGAWITLARQDSPAPMEVGPSQSGPARALCLSCADLDHLLFLPSGNAALTGRAAKHSALSAVVLKWSRARKRYERQGLLVTSEALEAAEEECLADQDVRARRQERAAERRAELDQGYVRRFAARVRELFPGCPAGCETYIAEHACLKYSGRVGRSAAAKDLDETAIRLAVVAHIRHTETEYDRLIAKGWGRLVARAHVEEAIRAVLAKWQGSE